MTMDTMPPPSQLEPDPGRDAPRPLPGVVGRPDDHAEDDEPAASGRIEIEGLNAFYGPFRALREVTLAIEPHAVTAIIGPSGCGKSTFLRALNRMHELAPDARIEGQVRLDGLDVYDPSVDPVQLRRVVGMVFQRPNPFPTMSIFDNVAAGLRLTGRGDRHRLQDVVVRCPRRAAPV